MRLGRVLDPLRAVHRRRRLRSPWESTRNVQSALVLGGSRPEHPPAQIRTPRPSRKQLRRAAQWAC